MTVSAGTLGGARRSALRLNLSSHQQRFAPQRQADDAGVEGWWGCRAELSRYPFDRRVPGWEPDRLSADGVIAAAVVGCGVAACMIWSRPAALAR